MERVSSAEHLGMPPAAGPSGAPRLRKRPRMDDADDQEDMVVKPTAPPSALTPAAKQVDSAVAQAKVTVKPVLFRPDPDSDYFTMNGLVPYPDYYKRKNYDPRDYKNGPGRCVWQCHGSDTPAVVTKPEGGFWMMMFHEEDLNFCLAFKVFLPSNVGEGSALSEFISTFIKPALTVEKFAVCGFLWKADPFGDYIVKIPVPEWLALDGDRPRQTLAQYGLKDGSDQALCLRVFPPRQPWPVVGYPFFEVPIWILKSPETLGLTEEGAEAAFCEYNHLLPVSAERFLSSRQGTLQDRLASANTARLASRLGEVTLTRKHV